ERGIAQKARAWQAAEQPSRAPASQALPQAPRRPEAGRGLAGASRARCDNPAPSGARRRDRARRPAAQRPSGAEQLRRQRAVAWPELARRPLAWRAAAGLPNEWARLGSPRARLHQRPAARVAAARVGVARVGVAPEVAVRVAAGRRDSRTQAALGSRVLGLPLEVDSPAVAARG